MIKDKMSSPIETIGVENRTIKDAADLMTRKSIGSLIVRDEIPGIITERDIVRAVSEGNADAPIEGYVQKPLVTINENKFLGDAAQLMITRKIRRLGVVDDDGQISGIINIRDVTFAVHEAFLAIFEVS